MKPATPLAENRISITKPLFNEAMRAVGNKEFLKALRIPTIIFVLLYLGIAVWTLYTGFSLFMVLGEAIFLAAILFWLFVMLPSSKRKSRYRAMSRGMDTAPARVISFYQSRMSVTDNTGKQTDIPYSEVTGWTETSHLYILNCTNNRSVLLCKNGFASGDFNIVKSVLSLYSRQTNTV